MSGSYRKSEGDTYGYFVAVDFMKEVPEGERRANALKRIEKLNPF
jgi:hypothetical protein